MFQTEVLITFYSRCGSTEKLALAAAVGAVQARANIRLRRLRDIVSETAEEPPECKENLDRMRKEYVAPSEADVLRADAIIFVAPAGFSVSSPEWTEYFDLLTRLRSEGKLDGKVGAAVDGGSETTLMCLSAAVLQLGFIAVPTGFGESLADRALVQGRRVATVARAVKQAAE